MFQSLIVDLYYFISIYVVQKLFFMRVCSGVANLRIRIVLNQVDSCMSPIYAQI